MIAWSHSALNAYETCPKRYYLTRVAKKVREKQTDATMAGQAVHDALDKYVSGQRDLPAKYEKYRAIADRVKSAPGEVMTEQKVALTTSLKPTAYFASDVWVRVVMDVAIVNGDTATILDWKTGKRKFDTDQLRLFAATGFSLWPDVKRINTGYIWLKEGKLDDESFTPDEAPVIWQGYTERVRRIEHSSKTDTWPAKPSGLCRNYCPVGRRLCEHCGTD